MNDKHICWPLSVVAILHQAIILCIYFIFNSADKVSAVLFSADWAEQCAQVRSVLAELAKRSGTSALQYVDVPAEELSEISLKHQIEAVPTVVFFKSGKAVDRVDGVDIAALTIKATKLAGSSSSASDATAKDDRPLEDRLKELINRHKVVIFMKGDRETPRCGFSRELIRIVNETGLPYDTFDILSDEEVRQGLKTYSDWPTYPQLYVNGDLIGGLDIIKEMVASDEFVTTLQS